MSREPLAARARMRQEPCERERQVDGAHVEAVDFGNSELESRAHGMHREARFTIGGDALAFLLEMASRSGIVKNQRTSVGIEGVDAPAGEGTDGVDAAAGLCEQGAGVLLGVSLRWREAFGAVCALSNLRDSMLTFFLGERSNRSVDGEDFGQRGPDDLMAAVVTAFAAGNVCLNRSEDASEVPRESVFDLIGEGLEPGQRLLSAQDLKARIGRRPREPVLPICLEDRCSELDPPLLRLGLDVEAEAERTYHRYSIARQSLFSET